ncbi:MAG: carbohydrate deacetylase [Christensenellales bacterium]|jgi:predicted glycoside hydrolase/deacetylase ChbG (UPF0249 family)
MKLIVNADDFGLTDGVTQGILDAMNRGIVTSTTMMVNMPGTQSAATIARENPNIAVGLHVNISLGSPLSNGPSLTENGLFLKPSALSSDNRYDEEELYQEMRAQYHCFVELIGRRPTHVDSHLYAHQKLTKANCAIRRLAEEEKLPVRDMATSRYSRTYFEGNFKVKPGETQEDLKEKCLHLIKSLLGYPVAELMVHPAFPDEWLLNNSSYNTQRSMEHAVLTDPDICQYISKAAVTLATFRDLE